MSDREYGIDSEIKTTKASILDIKSLQDNNQDELEKMKIDLNSIKNQIRLVKLRQNEPDSKLGFSLRGGKLNNNHDDDVDVDADVDMFELGYVVM